MQFRDVFTPDVLKDPELTTLLAYCLNELSDLENTTIVKDDCVSIKPREVLIVVSELTQKLNLSQTSILNKLNLLERLKKISIQYSENYFIVSVHGIQFPILPTQQKLDPVTNIIPIYINDWKNNDISSIRGRHAANSVELVGISLDLFIQSTGSIFLHEITINHGFEFIAYLKKGDRSINTLNTYLRTVKASFQRAVYRGYLKESPLAKVRSLPVSKNPPVVIEDYELEEILKNISSDFGKLGVLMALHTGMRRDEIRNMQWSDIDYENERIIVRNSGDHHTKFFKQRYIPLNQGLIGLINEIKLLHTINQYSSVYLFINHEGERFSKNYFTKLFQRARDEAGINKKVCFHSLRKTFASRLSSRGVSINTIKELLGHADQKTTHLYVGTLDSDMKNAMNVLSYTFYSAKVKS